MGALLGLSDEQRMLRETAGKIAGAFGHAYYADCARRGEPAAELWRQLGAAGFVGPNLSAPYGGGMGLTELYLVLEEVAAHGCPMLMLVVSPGICGSILDRHASDAQKDAWLPAIAAGTAQMAFAITEPDAGSNTHNVATTATRNGDGWRLRGTKHYISGAEHAAAILVVARTGHDHATARGRLSLFVVPTDAAGVRIAPIPMELVAAEKQNVVYFDDVALGPEALIGEEGAGLRQVFSGLNPERILIGALATGIGRYALDKAARYARERAVWGTPIGAHQGLAHPLAEAHIGLQLARLVALRAAAMFDAGEDAAEAANIAKFAGSEAGIRALDQAIQVHGGNGLAQEYGLADLWFIARLTRSAPVSREMVLNYVAQHSLNLPKSY
jgi:alkylation response protein AidB-like acyl-CoA dehydrogenase